MPSPARPRLKDATESTPTLDDYRRPGWTATSFLGVGIFTTFDADPVGRAGDLKPRFWMPMAQPRSQSLPTGANRPRRLASAGARPDAALPAGPLTGGGCRLG